MQRLAHIAIKNHPILTDQVATNRKIMSKFVRSVSESNTHPHLHVALPLS